MWNFFIVRQRFNCRESMAKLRNLFGACLCAFFLLSAPAIAAEQTSPDIPNVNELKKHFSSFKQSPELVGEIDKIIDGLAESVPIAIRIDLDVWKQKALADISDTNRSTEFARTIYQKYTREDYASDEQYGATMQRLVQAFSKTNDLEIALSIVQSMRESVYESPNKYLEYIIDRCRMEIYIETFNYSRALEIELSILNNPDYADIDQLQAWRPKLLIEISFLYNRLSQGEKALEYLDLAELTYLQKEEMQPVEWLNAHSLMNGNRGRAYLLLGRYAEAEVMGDKVLKAGQELGQNYLIALGYRLKGAATYNLGKYELAKSIQKTGVAISNTHNIATMQKYLYLDYAKTLEALGDYKEALECRKKHFSLEIASQRSVATARAELYDVEIRALQNHEEVQKLRRENNIQRDISARDQRIRRLLVIVIFSLVFCSVCAGAFIWYLRLGQRKLKISEQKANIANLAKSEFLANMSHEIRTPMNGVLGMTQVLRQTQLTEKQAQCADIIGKSGNHLMSILNDVLDFSKIEANKLELNLAPCNLESVIRDVVNMLSGTAVENALTLDCLYPEGTPRYVIADVDRLKQVLSNLLGNALKFTKEGGVMVRVIGSGAAVEPGTVVKLQINVTDTGIGIEPDKLDLIFEKFTQAESSTTRNFGGTGLGLAISQRLVHAMGGELTVVSKLGHGATFSVSLPLEIVSQQGIEVEASETLIPFVPQKITQKADIHILIAEDDAVNQTVIMSMLSHPNIKLTMCENGAEAFKHFKTTRFDLVLMDVSMPVMNGIEATKFIRLYESKSAASRTPIICLSAHIRSKDRQTFLAAGMDNYVPKPFKKSELLSAMKAELMAAKRSSNQQATGRDIVTLSA